MRAEGLEIQMVDQAGAPWVCPRVLHYRRGDWGGRPSLLGICGQGEEDAAYRGLDLGQGHEPKALRSSATEQPGLSVQQGMAMPASPHQCLLPAHLESPCNEQAAVKRKEKRKMEKKRGGP